jgi:hypothetical protein
MDGIDKNVIRKKSKNGEQSGLKIPNNRAVYGKIEKKNPRDK